MLLTLKFLTLATLFVVTGGAVFADWGRRHRLLVVLASGVATVAAFYLIRDIYSDLKSELHQELAVRWQEPKAAPPSYPIAGYPIAREAADSARQRPATPQRAGQEEQRPIAEPRSPQKEATTPAVKEVEKQTQSASVGEKAAAQPTPRRQVLAKPDFALLEVRPALTGDKGSSAQGPYANLVGPYSEEASRQVAQFLKSRGARLTSQYNGTPDVIVAVTGRGRPDPRGNAPGSPAQPAVSELTVQAYWTADNSPYPLDGLVANGTAQVAFEEHMDDPRVVSRLVLAAMKDLEAKIPTLQAMRSQ